MNRHFRSRIHVLVLCIVGLLPATLVGKIPLGLTLLPAVRETGQQTAVERLPPPAESPAAEPSEPALTDPSVPPDKPGAPGEPAAANETPGWEESAPEEIVAEFVEEESWYDPSTWITSEIWEGGVEMGLNGAMGNADTLSFRAGANAKRETEWHITSWDLTYSKTEAESIETQHNAIANLERKWLIRADTPWTLFGKGSWEYDEFKAFDGRLVLNTGLGLYVVRDDMASMYARLGTGTSREFNGPSDEWVPEAVWGLELERKLSSQQKITGKMEYLPDWSDYSDFRYDAEAAWETVLDEENGLRLKLSVRDRYDSTPNGARPNDIDYALLLLWKL